MGELNQLKKRIDESGVEGILTADIREDYEPAGDMMIYNLTNSGGYVQRRTPMYDTNSKWRIFNRNSKPY